MSFRLPTSVIFRFPRPTLSFRSRIRQDCGDGHHVVSLRRVSPPSVLRSSTSTSLSLSFRFFRLSTLRRPPRTLTWTGAAFVTRRARGMRANGSSIPVRWRRSPNGSCGIQLEPVSVRVCPINVLPIGRTSRYGLSRVRTDEGPGWPGRGSFFSEGGRRIGCVVERRVGAFSARVWTVRDLKWDRTNAWSNLETNGIEPGPLLFQMAPSVRSCGIRLS